MRTGKCQPDWHAAIANRTKASQHASVVEDAALQRRRVDLIQREVGSEERLRLGELTLERRERMVLDLVMARVDLPVGRIPVSPFRRDRDFAGRDLAAAEP